VLFLTFFKNFYSKEPVPNDWQYIQRTFPKKYYLLHLNPTVVSGVWLPFSHPWTSRLKKRGCWSLFFSNPCMVSL